MTLPNGTPRERGDGQVRKRARHPATSSESKCVKRIDSSAHDPIDLGEAMYEPFLDVKTRKVSVKESHVARRAIAQEIRALEYGIVKSPLGLGDIINGAGEIPYGPRAKGEGRQNQGDGGINLVDRLNPRLYAARVEFTAATGACAAECAQEEP